MYTATATIPAGTFAAGNVITYNGEVTDTAATPLTTVLGAGAPITMEDPPVLNDPFPVFGAIYLYDGTEAGGYNPILGGDGITVDVTYTHATNGLTTVSTTTVGGFYTVDIDQAIPGDPYGIEVETGAFNAGTYDNVGFDWEPVVAAYAVGGVQIDVTCGIPYEVVITNPIDLGSVIAGVGFLADYEIYDIDGELAQGYYSHGEGDMIWTSSDGAFIAPATTAFDGTSGATPGVGQDTLTLWTPPQQTIRIGENGLASNDFLTPWGDFGPLNRGGVSTQVYLDDWDEITLNILGDSFDWNVVNGWNIISVPMDPVDKGGDGVFGAFDALAACNAVLADPTLVVAERTPAGTYNVVDLSVVEGVAADFPMDGTHGYWVYSETGGVVNVLALDYVAVGVNVVNAAAGWNLLGFTHNFGTGTWNTGTLSADYLTTLLPGVAMTTKIVATEWDYGTQGYYSYVVTPTFVMPSRSWTWDFTYSAMPGNGFYLWLDAAAVITFPMDF
jgi:hypothetical protein